jgi:hypothetical protein
MIDRSENIEKGKNELLLFSSYFLSTGRGEEGLAIFVDVYSPLIYFATGIWTTMSFMMPSALKFDVSIFYPKKFE